MLPAAARLRRSQDFTLTVRNGRRAARGALVVHLLPADEATRSTPGAPGAAGAAGAPGAARVGFIAGRGVGGSVDRHRVVRRLRHLVRARLSRLPAGTLVVVRALPAARHADSATLGRDLDAALDRLMAPPAAAAHRGQGSEVTAADPRPGAVATSPGRPGVRT